MQPTQTAAPKPPIVIAKVQPQRSALASSQPTTYLIVDDQQPGRSRQLMFALSPTKTFNPPLVASGQQVHKTLLDYQVSLEVFNLYYSTSRLIHGHFPPLNLNQYRQQCQLPLRKTSKTSQPVQPAESAQVSRLACIQSHLKGPSKGHPNLSKKIIQLHIVPKTKQNTPSNTYTYPIHITKLCE